MKTTLFLSGSNEKFKVMELPERAQYAPVHDIVVSDFNNDGHTDLILLGNSSYFKLRIGNFDANYGTLLLGNGDGVFTYVNQKRAGINVFGNVRSSMIMEDKLLLGIPGEALKAYQLLK
jgi:hypothetical protein